MSCAFREWKENVSAGSVFLAVSDSQRCLFLQWIWNNLMPATCGGISSLDLSSRIWFSLSELLRSFPGGGWKNLGNVASVFITIIPRNELLCPNVIFLTQNWCLLRMGGSLWGQKLDVFIYSFNLAVRQDQLRAALRHFCIKHLNCFFLLASFASSALAPSSHGLSRFKSSVFRLYFSL